MGKTMVNIKLDVGAKIPTRAYPTDAGADLYSIEDVFIPAGEYRTIKTGVHIQIPKGYFGLLQSKSGLNSKYGITCRGVIDEGYTDEIKCTLINNGADYFVKKGDKITQLILIPCLYAEFNEVNSLVGGERGNNGFGSTGK